MDRVVALASGCVTIIAISMATVTMFSEVISIFSLTINLEYIELLVKHAEKFFHKC